MATSTPIAELFGVSTSSSQDWNDLSTSQQCPFARKKCFKVRKSDPSISIGTCVIKHGRSAQELIICPNRFLSDQGQVFADSLHLLKRHEPGNQFHVVPEVSIPGGSVDYFLVSSKGSQPIDFVGIEFQALDTTGTAWPHRQAFLRSQGVSVTTVPKKPMGINWKMTAKTTLIQLHHKIETFQAIGRRLVLVLQQELLDYMAREFTFTHLEDAEPDNSLHFHPYRIVETGESLSLELLSRKSTNAEGLAKALELRQNPRVEVSQILADLASKIGTHTRFNPVL